MKAREFHLARRPHGWPTEDDFRLVEVELPEPGDGQVLVRNRYVSVDPYMRGKMNDVKSYTPPYRLDAPMDGGALGEVVESRSAERKAGDLVVHQGGWRDATVVDAARTRVVDPELAPETAYLGLLGGTGLTAVVGLVDIAGLKEGDTVFVSGAAGAVGSVAGQVAKLLGASRVIGSAGSARKVEYLRELGFDAAFDYHDRPVRESLKEAAPDGIDLYFDNVGGDHLEAAIGRLNTFGRVALCGAVSQYNASEPPPGPRNLSLAVGKQLTLRGFIVSSYWHRSPEVTGQLAGWLREGRLRSDETVVDGLENTPRAFLDLMRGANIGKMLVRVGGE